MPRTHDISGLPPGPEQPLPWKRGPQRSWAQLQVTTKLYSASSVSFGSQTKLNYPGSGGTQSHPNVMMIWPIMRQLELFQNFRVSSGHILTKAAHVDYFKHKHMEYINLTGTHEH